jgi:hypothetical protein
MNGKWVSPTPTICAREARDGGEIVEATRAQSPDGALG